MKEQIENIVEEAKKVADIIKLHSGSVRVVSHYDADGITSASILVRALLRENKSFHLSLVKQLNEDVIEDLSKEENSLVVFLDFGSGQLDNIQKYLLDKVNRVIISDHHQIQGSISQENRDRVIHINPVDFGIADNVSGSGMSYLIARAMNPENRDLSGLAIIGAIGDSQIGSIEEDWGLSGLNKEILKDSEKTNKISVEKGLRLWGRYTRPVHKSLEYSIDPFIPGVSGSESASVQFLNELGIELKNDRGGWRTLADLSEEEQQKLASGMIKERIRGNEDNPEWVFGDVYELLDKGNEFRNANEFATLLNACGKLKKGYLGIALCLNDPESFAEVPDVLETYRKGIGKALNWVYRNKEIIKTTENANYILARNKISEHIISNVTSILSRSGMVPEKPTFAFANTDDGKVKISARASEKLIKDGIDLKNIIVEAVKETGGEGGGHKASAGATIPLGSEESFINCVERILKKPTNKEGKENAKETI